MFNRYEMLDLVVVDGQAKGIITRNLVTGAIEAHAGDAVVLGTGGRADDFYLPTKPKATSSPATGRPPRLATDFAPTRFHPRNPPRTPPTGADNSQLTQVS